MTAAEVYPTRIRWNTWLDGIGVSPRPERPVLLGDRVEAETGDAPQELFVRQIFAAADLEERRSIDLLFVALLERGRGGDGDTGAVELVVVGPDALRAQIVAGPSGFTVTELRLAPVAPRLRTVLAALVRVSRAGRSREVLESIEALGRLLDYGADPHGSAAAAHAVVRRLEVLTSGPGVRVSVAGALRRPADPTTFESLHLLADAELGLDDEVELRDGRLTVTSATTGGTTIAATRVEGGAATPRRASPGEPVARDRRPWTGGDYILLRTGRPARRQAAEARPLWQRKQEHALTDVGLGAETAEEADSYSSRAAAVRQAGRAQQIVELTLAGDETSAAAILSSALTQPGAEGPLLSSLAAGIGAETDYWALRSVVRRVRADPHGGPKQDRIVGLLEDRVGQRLDQLLGLGPPEDSGGEVPVTTPIVLEVSDALTPIVDSRVDGGHFLYELIPAMRDRVCDVTGVVVPGVRARGNPGLALGAFLILIDEIPVIEVRMSVDGRYSVRSVADEPVPADADIADVHPIDGAPGRWRIDPLDGPAGSPDPRTTFSGAQYIVHRLERVIRVSLGTMLGLQEVDALLQAWRAEDTGGVLQINGLRAEQRLTALLQDLVTERVPIVDWRAVIDAVTRAGGIDSDLRTLHSEVRRRLRHALPGLRTGPAAVRVPDHLQAALAGRGPAQLASTAHDPAHGQLEFLGWLRRAVEEVGPVLSLITGDDVRPLVAALARAEGTAVVTLSEEEVAAG